MKKSVYRVWSNKSEVPSSNSIESPFDETYYSELKEKLNIELESDIICIADVSYWYGRCSGYKIIGKNISDCLKLSSECNEEWYIDILGDLRGKLTHSFEGTSYYLYRAFKKNLSAKQIENFKNKILEGSLTQKDISTYTERIGPYIKNIMTSRCNNDII